MLHVADEERGARLIVAAGGTEGDRLARDGGFQTRRPPRDVGARRGHPVRGALRGDGPRRHGRLRRSHRAVERLLAFKRAVLQIETSDPYDRACESLCFLSARSDILEGPVLLSGGRTVPPRVVDQSRGDVRGGSATDAEGDGARGGESEEVTTIATDPENHHVFTGDSAGHVRVFDVSGLNLSGVDATGSATDPSSTVVEPARGDRIDAPSRPSNTSPRRLLMIASVDARVDLWTLEGARVGVFGRPATWNTRGEPRRTPGVEMRRRASDRGASTRWLRCVPTFHPPPSAPMR